MDPWDNPKPSREYRYRSRRDHPSFSSTLLDQIYRSIDDSSGDAVFYGDSMRKKKQLRGSLEEDRGSCAVVSEKIVVHRRSIAADLERSRAQRGTDSVFFKHSSSSSSDSSGFSSSESDSFYGRSRSSRSPPVSRDHAADIRQPKPIRTSVERFERSPQIHRSGVQKPNGKQELGSFLRTKSKALKIYSDLKKVKQPISPGGRLASFLNSLFTAGNAKKLKKMSTTTSNTAAAAAAEQALSSTCSSASSFSRSCLSKTPSSSGKSKRSVRFCPVSVILDEDSRPCGHKRLYEDATNHNRNHKVNFDAMEIRVMEENRRVIEAAKDLLRTYQKKDFAANTRVDVIDINNGDEDIDEDEDDDDAASCASSDLFELDNLSAIGIERYREELPVYETTHLGTNRAIANGLIV